MRFDVVTLFPELFAPFLATGVTRRAFEIGQVDVRLWNLRDFADGNYRRVDDRPFGGGPGMVMMAEPLARCLAAVRADRDVGGRRRRPRWCCSRRRRARWTRRWWRALVGQRRRDPGLRPLRRHRPALHRRATSTCS